MALRERYLYTLTHASKSFCEVKFYNIYRKNTCDGILANW